MNAAWYKIKTRKGSIISRCTFDSTDRLETVYTKYLHPYCFVTHTSRVKIRAINQTFTQSTSQINTTDAAAIKDNRNKPP